MQRRDLFKGVAASAVAWPLLARAQPSPIPFVGYLSARAPRDTMNLLSAFKSGFAEKGFIEGQTAAIEYRWARGQYDRLPSMAAELVRRSVSVLATTGGEPAVFAASAATSTIPI